MPTPATESRGVGGAAKEVAERASTLARLELELAGIELKRKVAALAVGIGLGLGAAIFALFMLGFALSTIAAALDVKLSHWLSLLIVTLLLLVLTAVLGMLALKSIRKGTPPVPTQAIEEAKLTSSALKSEGA